MTMNQFLKTSAKVVLYALSIAALVVGIEGEPVAIVVGLLGMGIWLGLTMFNLDFSKLDSSNALVYQPQPKMKALPAPKTPLLESKQWEIEEVPDDSKSA